MGLTETPVPLLRWMITGPEIARLLEEFDEHSDKQYGKQSTGVHAEFRKDVSELIEIVYGMGNPFCDEGKDLTPLTQNNSWAAQ